MPEEIPLTKYCCDDPPSTQPTSGECEWCKLTIFFDPVDEECGECKFSTGDPNADYHWAESNRTVDKVSPKDEEAGWHCEGPNCGEDPAAATGAYHVSYHLPEGEVEEENCNHLLEKDEEEEYIYYPDLVVPYDIDAANVEATTGTLQWGSSSGPWFASRGTAYYEYAGNGVWARTDTAPYDAYIGEHGWYTDPNSCNIEQAEARARGTHATNLDETIDTVVYPPDANCNNDPIWGDYGNSGCVVTSGSGDSMFQSYNIYTLKNNGCGGYIRMDADGENPDTTQYDWYWDRGKYGEFTIN